MNRVDHARRFLMLADRDIKAFRVLKRDPEVSLVSVCFHAEQAVEKCLKAVLALHGAEFRKTHDLSELAYSVQDCSVSLPFLPEVVGQLTPYAASLRYEEMEIATVTVDEAERMVETINEGSKASCRGDAQVVS